MERATAETLSEWVNRLWTRVPEPAWGITCVTEDKREKYEEKRMRSISMRNSSSPVRFRSTIARSRPPV